MRRWLTFLFPILVILLAIIVRIAEPPFVEEIRLKVFDFYQKQRPRLYHDVPPPGRGRRLRDWIIRVAIPGRRFFSGDVRAL